MNSVNKLINYVEQIHKAPSFGGLSWGKKTADPGNPVVPADQGNPVVPAVPAVQELYTPGQDIPTADRMYLDKEGFIPNTQTRPKDIDIPFYVGPKKGNFIDKRVLQTHKPETYEHAHPKSNQAPSYGGIVVNDEGKILIRHAKNNFGFGGAKHAWTLAKGRPDGTETPQEAALREVLEETGITAKIMDGGEVPGHYGSEYTSSKYFLMSVDTSVDPQPFKGANTGDEETSEIKWVTPQEALDIFHENVLEGQEDEDGDPVIHKSSMRDIEAVAAAMHHHKREKPEGRRPVAEFFKARSKSTGREELDGTIDNMVTEFVANRKFPDDFQTNEKYSHLRNLMRLHTDSPQPVKTADGTNSDGLKKLKEILPRIFQGLDKEYGVKGSGTYSWGGLFQDFFTSVKVEWSGPGGPSGTGENTMLLLEQVAMGNPETADPKGVYESGAARQLNYIGNTAIPRDVDRFGEPIYRSQKDRKEIMDAYTAWTNKTGNLSEAQGKTLENIDTKLNNLLKGITVYESGMTFGPSASDVAEVNFTIEHAKKADVPGYMIKDKIRDLVSEKFGLEKESVAMLKKKMDAIGLKGVPVSNKKPGLVGEGTGLVSQSAAKGTFSWGEKYDFDTEDTSIIHRSTGTYGGTWDEKVVPSYELMYSRAKHAHTAYAGIHDKLTKARMELGNKLIAGGKVTTKDPLEAAHEFMHTMVSTMQKASRVALDATWPDTDHIIMWRKTRSPREIVGDGGLEGSDAITEEQLHARGLPRPEEEDENGPGYRVNVASSSVAGMTIDPRVHNGRYMIGTLAHKDDFIALHSLIDIYQSTSESDNPDTGQIYEQESMIKSDPKRHTVVINNALQGGKIAGSDNWIDTGAGWATEGLFGHEDNANIDNPEVNYAEQLKPVSSADYAAKTGAKQGSGTGAVQLGSNKGGLYEMNGDWFYIKHDSPKSHYNEVLANNIYEAAGINVPTTKIIDFGGKPSVMSKWLPDVRGHKTTHPTPGTLSNNQDIQDGFLVDCLLANHDVVGLHYDNVADSKDKTYRLDQGGALDLRAQGDDKQFFHNWQDAAMDDKYIRELSSMRDPAIAEKASHVFKNMDDTAMGRAAINVLKLSNTVIQELVENSSIDSDDRDKMAKTLISRRDSIVEWLVDTGVPLGNKNAPMDKKALQDEYNLLKMELLKATKPKLEASKKRLTLWVDGYSSRKQDESHVKAARLDLANQIDKIQELYRKDVALMEGGLNNEKSN